MERALISSIQLDEVWAQLEQVMDPELDEPVTDMGFIEAVSVTGPAPDSNRNDVEVIFRLPTYWCSPNFAFLMAEGIKRSVEELPWVAQAVVLLQDHMAAEEMNAAINAGRSFGSVFEDLHPGEDLSALRKKFDQKAFQRRQEVVIKALIAAGCPVDEIVALPLDQLQALSFADAEDARQKVRYLDLLLSRGLARGPGDLALTTWDGAPIPASGFKDHMGLLRSVRINMEFSGSLCRGLKSNRYKEADLSGAVPVLVDFAKPETSHACR